MRAGVVAMAARVWADLSIKDRLGSDISVSTRVSLETRGISWNCPKDISCSSSHVASFVKAIGADRVL